MPTEFSVATWNLERPGVRSWKRVPAIRDKIATISADCWVLTETRRSIEPGDGFYGVHSPDHPSRREDSDECWVSVWSRWPTRKLQVRESFWSATALVDAPFGQIIVHGVVLPYRNEPNPNGDSLRVWAEFTKELLLQSEDWTALRREYPEVPLVVAGDFNQNLDGERWYGNADTYRDLGFALKRAGLRCLTTEEMVALGKLKTKHLVDHICVSADLSGNRAVECWEPVNSDRVRMSDHAGVAARLAPTEPANAVSRLND